jgi:hypothetical protein
MRLVITASILLALASVARAEPPGLTPPSPVDNSDTGSYRLQTLGFDAAALGLGIAAVKRDSDALLEAAAVAYVGGPALVHLYHHHPGRAAASVALRVGLPLLGALIGLSSVNTSSPDCDECGIGAGILGFAIGSITASAIDIGYLSRGEDRAAPAALPPPPPPSQPLASPEPHEVRVGFAFPF